MSSAYGNGHPDNYVIVIDEYGELVHDHPVNGTQVSWIEPSWDVIEAAQLMAGKIVVCESEPEKLWADYNFLDRDHGGPDVNHYRCLPSMHSRDISRQNIIDGEVPHKPVLLADGRSIFVQLCSDCRAPLFYCNRAEWYFHLGRDVNECWRHNEASWDLGTAGFQTEDGKPEPNEHAARVRGHEGHIHQCGCPVDLRRCETERALQDLRMRLSSDTVARHELNH